MSLNLFPGKNVNKPFPSSVTQKSFRSERAFTEVSLSTNPVFLTTKARMSWTLYQACITRRLFRRGRGATETSNTSGRRERSVSPPALPKKRLLSWLFRRPIWRPSGETFSFDDHQVSVSLPSVEWSSESQTVFRGATINKQKAEDGKWTHSAYIFTKGIFPSKKCSKSFLFSAAFPHDFSVADVWNKG